MTAGYSHQGVNRADKFPQLDSVTRVLPIYVFGDSHSLGFKDTVAIDDVTGQTIAARVRYFSTIGCTAETFYTEARGFHPELSAALEHEGLLRWARPVHLSFKAFDLRVGYSTGLPQAPPLIVINAGDIDLRSDFLPLLKDELDIVLPEETPYGTADLPLMPLDLFRQRLEARMSALVRGVAALRAYGFVRTYLHCVVPPTVDDAQFERVNKYRCPRNTRYKVALMCNRYLAEQCKVRGIPFVDIWPDVTRDGFLRPEYELDGVHLAPSSVPFSLAQVLRHGVLHDAGVNYRRYELLYQLARGQEVKDDPVPTLPTAPIVEPTVSSPRRLASKCKGLLKRWLSASMRQRLRGMLGRRAEPAVFIPNIPNVPAPQAIVPLDDMPKPMLDAIASFEREGVCTVPIEPKLFQKWRSMLDYSRDLGNRHVNFEWYGNPIKPLNDNMRYAEPPQELLDDLASLLDGRDFDRFFQTVLGTSVMVLNCRPFMSLPHETTGTGPQSLHRDGCPAGLLRGVLYLTDVTPDAGPFEYQDSAGEMHQVTAPAGTLLIFDANRLLHRGSPPRTIARKVLDFVFCARLPGQPMLVIDAGMNSWPYDPFQYTLHGMKTSPSLDVDRVSLPPYDVGQLLPLRVGKPRAIKAA